MTFSRRIGERFNRGRIAAQAVAPSVVVTTPLTIITSVPVLQWIRGDLGVVLGTGVSTLADQSGNGHHFAQGTGAAQPAYTASDPTLNNQATFTGDGSNDTLLNATMPNGAGNWMSGIIKTAAWVTNKALWGANAAPECGDVLTISATPILAMFNGSATTNQNNGLAVATWGRIEAHYSGAASYLKLIANTVSSGVSPGVATSTGCALFSTIGVAIGNFGMAERVVCGGKPTPAEITALDAYYTARYGPGFV